MTEDIPMSVLEVIEKEIVLSTGKMPMVGMGFFLTLDVSKFSNLIPGHGGRVVTLSPPTSVVGVRFPALPQVGNLVVACH